MSEKTVVVTSGLSVGFVLFCIFMVLKLTGFIDWSWALVVLPLFAPLLVVLGVVGLVAVVLAITAALSRAFTVPWRR